MLRTHIILKHISLCVSSRTLISHFSTTVPYGSKIGVVGRNGCGKSTLLKILSRHATPSTGECSFLGEGAIAYIPQTITENTMLSGGQRFNKALSEALSQDPELLLLDEPTNHLDAQNRYSLMRMLQSYTGTLIVATHDPTFLRTCVSTLWHIEGGAVVVSHKSYDEYRQEVAHEKEKLTRVLSVLNREKKELHAHRMKEQERVKKRKASGEKRYTGDTIALRAKQGSGEATSNKNNRLLNEAKRKVLRQLSDLSTPPEIIPTFSFKAGDASSVALVTVSDGSVGYVDQLVSQISFTLHSRERIAVMGRNGTGKSTLLRALAGDPTIVKTGYWHAPTAESIGYLDQHYSDLDGSLSVYETLHQIMPHAQKNDIRSHLNRYLFRTNEEVSVRVELLSGGEKARLCLAIIGAKTPKLLILDEVTNNLDLESRQHVIEVLLQYPGALLVVSHDEDFLEHVGITTRYEISQSIWVFVN